MLQRLLFACTLVALAPGALLAQRVVGTGGPDEAIPVRCVNPAGTAFDDCGGAGGSGGTSQVDNTALDTLTAAGALYDTTPPAVTDGNVGVFRMNVNRMLLAVLADGQGDSVMDDANNAARVNCVTGCSGSSFADNAAFTFGTTPVNIAGGVLDDTAPNAATENSAAAARISANRMLLFQLGDGAGNERRAGVTAAGALQTDGSGVTQPVSGTVNVGTFPDNEPINVAQFGGSAVATGVGAAGAGVPRVTTSIDARTYNSPTAATVGTSSAQALASNATRKALIAINTSVNTISCAVGAAAVLNSGITLEPGAAFNMLPEILGTGALNCIASAASSNLSLQEIQ